jgi:hypothetical protein
VKERVAVAVGVAMRSPGPDVPEEALLERFIPQTHPQQVPHSRLQAGAVGTVQCPKIAMQSTKLVLGHLRPRSLDCMAIFGHCTAPTAPA